MSMERSPALTETTTMRESTFPSSDTAQWGRRLPLRRCKCLRPLFSRAENASPNSRTVACGCNSDSSRAKYDGVFSFACKRAPRCPAAYCKRLDQAGGFGRNGIWNFIGLFSQFCVRDQYIFGKAAPPPCTLGISLREDRVGVHAVPTRISFTFLPTWTTSETISCPKSPPIVTLWPRCSAHTDKPLHRFHRCYLNGFL